MKSGAVIVSIFDILNKIFRCYWGFFLLSSDISILPSEVTNLTKVSPVAIAKVAVVKVQAVTKVTRKRFNMQGSFTLIVYNLLNMQRF
ncbi:hypothetical protein PROPEN_01534 [Proteus penneri ATCC 35198]|nr:hypothetical protein PROPEN_01534 [Proteus penneri ATCC 35198]